MATNCGSGGATARTAYVQDLMQYMQVDSFGKCLHNKDVPPEMDFPIYSNHGASMKNKIQVFAEYKFVLTFENNNVTDYVTEKIMNVFQGNIFLMSQHIESSPSRTRLHGIPDNRPLDSRTKISC
jgi:hypothetical protein